MRRVYETGGTPLDSHDSRRDAWRVVETFGQWIASRMAQLDGMSTRDVERRSGTHPVSGRPLVSHSTVNKYVNGQRSPHRISDDVVTGLARALEVSENEVRRRAGRAQPQPEWRLPPESRLLSPRDRRYVEDLIRRLATSGGDHGV
jgi:transcriptional regulator with XRE-family HTH domain